MTSSGWNSDNVYLSVLIFACMFFRKTKYTQNFLLNSIRENKYMLKMHKIHISQNTRKKYAQI